MLKNLGLPISILVDVNPLLLLKKDGVRDGLSNNKTAMLFRIRRDQSLSKLILKSKY